MSLVGYTEHPTSSKTALILLFAWYLKQRSLKRTIHLLVTPGRSEPGCLSHYAGPVQGLLLQLTHTEVRISLFIWLLAITLLVSLPSPSPIFITSPWRKELWTLMFRDLSGEQARSGKHELHCTLPLPLTASVLVDPSTCFGTCGTFFFFVCKFVKLSRSHHVWYL